MNCPNSACACWKCCASRMEDKVVTISRAQGSLTFPANFQLVAAMNPCPCGYYGDPVKPCTCSNMVVTKYQKRISGPLLDRIDIHVEVPRVEYEKLSECTLGRIDPRRCANGSKLPAQRQRERFARRGGRHPSGCGSPATPICARRRCASSARWMRPART